nr:MAG TPA: hypothetical protein [Caudoviricetes sp.]
MNRFGKCPDYGTWNMLSGSSNHQAVTRHGLPGLAGQTISAASLLSQR